MNPFSCLLPQPRTSSPATPSSSKPYKSSTQPGLNWPFGLDQVRERVPAQTVSVRRFSQDGQTPTDSSLGAALPVVNLDEVTHDIYRGSVFAAEALEGHPGHIADALKDEEETFEDQPFDWFNHQHSTETHLHAVTSLGVNVAMLPLSALAIRAGLQETRHALKHTQTLKRRQTTLQAQRDRLSQLQHTPMHLLSQAECQVREQLMSDLALDRQLTNADLGSGLSSTTAGSAILAKTATTIGLSLGCEGALIGSGAEEAAHLSHLAAGAGFVSSVVLGPLASLSAVSLGAFFLYQSKLEKGALEADIKRIHAFLASLDESTLCPRAQRYAKFLTEKLQQRKKFISRYDGWNTAFAAGSGAYAAGTLTKTGLTAATIAGGSVAAGPVGLGIIAGVGALGAASMSVSSHQYFLNHNKHKRYRAYESQDMPVIDRRFLVIADVLEARAQTAHPRAARNGFELRAALYAQIDGQEKALTQFLSDATQQLHKRDINTRRSTDSNQPVASTAIGTRFGLETKAILSAASAYGQQLLRGHPHRAKRDAKQAYAAQTQALTEPALAQWLEQPDSWPAQIDYMQTALELEQHYLTTKLATRQDRQLISLSPPCGADASAQEQLIRTAQMDLIEHLRQAHATDQDRLRTISTLIDDMHHLKGSGRLTSDLLTAWRTRFMKLQCAMDQKKPRKPKPQTTFAHFCLHTAYKRTSAARGILLSVEKQAARLRERFQASPPATVAPEVSSFAPPIRRQSSQHAVAAADMT